MRFAAAFVVCCCLLQSAPRGQAARADATTVGAFVVEPATQLSLGFDWRIAGDDNRSARVDVAYRKTGEQAWRDALPLLRLQNEVVGQKAGTLHAENPFNYVAPNMFSGSILNLEPDTAYEARFTLSDPDGVQGEATKTVTVRTKKAPDVVAGGSVYHVYPIGYEGPRQEPAFTGLMPAYYITCHTSDWQNAYPARVQPGDVILVHAGLYLGNRLYYPGSGNPPGPERLSLCTLFDGTYYLTQSGTAEKPIVIKAAGDGEVIFDGDGAYNLFNLMSASYNYFEGITFRNAEVAFLLGTKSIGGASGFALKNSRLYDVGRGVQSDWSGAKDFYIADNTFIGRRDPFRLMGLGKEWAAFPGYPVPIGGKSGSDYAVKIYGQGHVVAHNFVANWNDGIDIATYGNPDGTPNELPDRVPVAIDLHNNDIFNVLDNCIEADGGARNIRVFRNRCFNSAGGALSSEPTLGGPVYFYENVVVNTPTGGPLRHVNTSAGLLVYQNTFIGEVRVGPTSNEHFLNNLVFGTNSPAPVFAYSTFTNYSTSDYNGFRPNATGSDAFEWSSPPANVRVDYKNNPTSRSFKTLRAYSDATGQDKHSLLVDYDVFLRAQIPDKSNLQRVYWWGDNDLRLKPGSAPIDAGTVIPTITDGFAGRAPDLGAYELNEALPVYGPRGVKGEINPALKVTPRGGPPIMKGTYNEEPWRKQ